MGWTILVLREDNHDKFWAYNGTRIRFGRIGSIGVEGSYENEYKVQSKINEKLNKGYRHCTAEEVNELFPSKILSMWEV
jgi:hypothetical protein